MKIVSIDYLSIIDRNRYVINRLSIDYLSITIDNRFYRLQPSGKYAKPMQLYTKNLKPTK